MQDTLLRPHYLELADGRRLQAQHLVSGGIAYRGPKGLTVLVSLDNTPKGELLHVSVSYPNHNPSWHDLRSIKDAFFGDDKAAMMILPEADYYVNCHEHCFHLWEVPGGWSWNKTI